MTAGRRDGTTSVAVVTSVHPLDREALVAAVETNGPPLVTVRHEIARAHHEAAIHRVVRFDGRELDRRIDIDLDCCLSCQVREDVLGVVDEVRGRAPILVVVPAGIEVGSIAAELDRLDGVALDVVATVVDPSRVEADLTQLADLPHWGGDGADATVGFELARQLRHCDVVLRPSASRRQAALLRALSGPSAQVTSSMPWWIGAGVHDPGALRRRRWPGAPTPTVDLDDDGVHARTWSARRPFHPRRLAELIGDRVLDDALHVSGHCWVATRRATVLSVEALGGRIVLGVEGVWQEALGPHDAEVLDIDDWHPYYGDRNQQVRVVTADAPCGPVVDALDDALVTDAELALGAGGWAAWHDPFDEWLSDEVELVDRHRQRRR